MAAGIAVLTLSGSIMPFSVSSAYHDYDVNQDGAVDIIDVITINKYLIGGFYVSESSMKLLDVNKNYIIDFVDSQSVMGYITTGKKSSFMFE